LDFAGARRGDATNQTVSDLSSPFRIASFGFLLPNKGLEQLLEAVKILKAGGHDVVLHMMNAEYPAQASREAIVAIDAKIRELELESIVTLDTIYYTDEECLKKLSKEDLVVFPYQETKESSSAAVRHAIASGAVVAVTPLAIFEDVTPAAIQFDGVTPEAIAKGISDVLAWNLDNWEDHSHRAEAWRKGHCHQVIAQRLEELLIALTAADR
jgi:glycosyltransferase involved in cell wall biosynthesis